MSCLLMTIGAGVMIFFLVNEFREGKRLDKKIHRKKNLPAPNSLDDINYYISLPNTFGINHYDGKFYYNTIFVANDTAIERAVDIAISNGELRYVPGFLSKMKKLKETEEIYYLAKFFVKSRNREYKILLHKDYLRNAPFVTDEDKLYLELQDD